MLEAIDLSCVRGDRCLFRALNLSVKPGQIMFVEGDNGSGKTSLLRLLVGLGLPAGGDVFWQGNSIYDQRGRYATFLLYLGHLVAQKEELNAAENLLADACLAGLAEVTGSQVRLALEQCGLGSVSALPVRLLSVGQRRRAALARLLLSPPPLWILDEPLTALDKAAVELLRCRLETHLSRGGMAVVASHQEMEFRDADIRRVRLST
jgi:heme exporter protein A